MSGKPASRSTHGLQRFGRTGQFPDSRHQHRALDVRGSRRPYNYFGDFCRFRCKEFSCRTYRAHLNEVEIITILPNVPDTDINQLGAAICLPMKEDNVLRLVVIGPAPRLRGDRLWRQRSWPSLPIARCRLDEMPLNTYKTDGRRPRFGPILDGRGDGEPFNKLREDEGYTRWLFARRSRQSTRVGAKHSDRRRADHSGVGRLYRSAARQ